MSELISPEEASRYDLLKSRATISNEAQSISAAELMEAMRMNAGRDEIAELQKALQNHIHNIETYVGFKKELEDRVSGAEKVPQQLADVAGKLAVHEYDRSKPVASESPYVGMSRVMQQKRNERAAARNTETMSEKMGRMRKAR